MRFLQGLLLALVFIAADLSGAASSSKIEVLVDQYYSSQGQKPRPLPDPPQESPPPRQCPSPISPRSCIEAACQQMSRFECDDPEDLSEVSQACRNVHGDCVKNLCSRMSRFACDEKGEVFEVASACRGVVDVSCIDYVCSRLSRFDCDDISELRDIARQCR